MLDWQYSLVDLWWNGCSVLGNAVDRCFGVPREQHEGVDGHAQKNGHSVPEQPEKCASDDEYKFQIMYQTGETLA